MAPTQQKQQWNVILSWANAVGTAFLIYQATGIERRFTSLEVQVAMLMAGARLQTFNDNNRDQASTPQKR